jgi:predicted small lipoprotein YifL
VRTAPLLFSFVLGLLLLLLLGAAGCGGDGPLDPVQAFLTPSPQSHVPQVHLIPGDDPRPWPMDPWTFQERPPTVTGDRLRLPIQYGGGCRVHRFALLVDPAFRESHPVQVSARLTHDADGDLCRALLSEDLQFDLAPLRRHHEASYGAGPGVIHIFLGGRRITYAF